MSSTFLVEEMAMFLQCIIKQTDLIGIHQFIFVVGGAKFLILCILGGEDMTIVSLLFLGGNLVLPNSFLFGLKCCKL
ncbi:MAG: hypothetical protein KBH01_00065 [Breznakibacter sp.]|nr:hypothetical protein [Breznakibacter sp.]